MSDASSLTAEIDRLTQAVGFWNSAIIVLMIGVAAVATSLVIAQQMAFKRADALAKVTNQLSKLKEGIANQNIAEAREKAGRAEQGAGEANERAERAALEAATAQSKAAELKIDLAQQTEKTAKAQTDAARYVGLVVKSVNPRLITNFERFVNSLKPVAKGTVEIWFEPNDFESREFAENLQHMLTSKEVGWAVKSFNSLPLDSSSISPLSENRTMLEELRIEAATGIAVGANTIAPDFKGDTMRGALINAINFGTEGWNISGVLGHWTRAFPEIPDGYFVIVVGHHQVNLPEFIPK